METPMESRTPEYIITGSIAIGFTLIATFLYVFYIGETLNYTEPVKADKFGQLGDVIGGVVGSLWAFAGVWLFYIALKEQRKDIRINQATLETQIEEMKIQGEAIKAQATEIEQTRLIADEQLKTLKRQQFESTFFQMLKMRNDMVHAYDVKDDVLVRGKGIGYIKSAKQTIEREIETLKQITTKKDDRSYLLKLTQRQVRKFHFHTTQENLAQFFVFNYRILKYLDDTELISKDIKQSYASIYRSQLSVHERYLILLNGITPDLGSPKHLKLLKDYKMYSNYNFDALDNVKEITPLVKKMFGVD